MRTKVIALLTLSLLLTSQLFTTACTTTDQAIVTSIIDGAVAVEQLVAAETGNPVNQTFIDSVQSAGQLYNALYADWQAATPTDKATAWGKVTVVAQAIQSQITQEFATFHVLNPSSQAKVTALVDFVIGQLDAWAPIVSGTSPASTAQLYAHIVEVSAKSPAAKQPKSASEFVKSFNRLMAVKTGNKAGDSRAKSLKIHNHSLPVRAVTLGIAK